MKRMITPRASRGSVAADVHASLRELKKIAAAVRLGRIANTVAATNGHAVADVAQLLGWALAVIEGELVHAHSAIQLVAAREHLRRFQKLVELANRSARIERLIQRAKAAHGRKPDPSKIIPKNDLKRLANSGGPHPRQR